MPNKYGEPLNRKKRNARDNRMGQTSRSDRPVREEDMGWNPATMGNRTGNVPPVKGGRIPSSGTPKQAQRSPSPGTYGNPTKQMVDATRSGSKASRQVGSQTGLQKAAMRRMKGLS